MNYRPWVVALGTAALGYIAWTQRNAQPTDQHRNRGLRYRTVGFPAEDYPEWVRALRGKSGVYVIRDLRQRDANGQPAIVYVGMSATGNLYETLTRHLQQWRRWERYWKGQYGRYGRAHDPGLTYDRGNVDIAVRVVSPDEAAELESKLIAKLAPRDNIIGQVDAEFEDEAELEDDAGAELEDAPF